MQNLTRINWLLDVAQVISQISVLLKFKPITPAITRTIEATFNIVNGSLNQNKPIRAIRKVPTPDQIAYVRLRSSFFITKVISVKLNA